MEINIIGMGEGRGLAPHAGIRWGITRVIHDTKVDMLFDMHSINNMDSVLANLFLNRLKLAERMGTVFYSINNIDNPVSVRYPIEKIVKEFGTSFFSDSVCYAIALAITKKPETISLYGINQARENTIEYTRNKPGVDFWVGMAMGRGIKVNINGEKSEVGKTFDHRAYGYNIKQTDMVKNYV